MKKMLKFFLLLLAFLMIFSSASAKTSLKKKSQKVLSSSILPCANPASLLNRGLNQPLMLTNIEGNMAGNLVFASVVVDTNPNYNQADYTNNQWCVRAGNKIQHMGTGLYIEQGYTCTASGQCNPNGSVYADWEGTAVTVNAVDKNWSVLNTANGALTGHTDGTVTLETAVSGNLNQEWEFFAV